VVVLSPLVVVANMVIGPPNPDPSNLLKPSVPAEVCDHSGGARSEFLNA
jgi:hypothetical protein